MLWRCGDFAIGQKLMQALPDQLLVRMSGSGATCFALFDSEDARDSAADQMPREWWHMATSLR